MNTRIPQSRHSAPFTLSALSLLTLSLLSSSAALAADNGWYVGTSYGETRSDDTVNEQILTALTGRGFTATSLNDDEVDHGYKLLSGYKFNDNFALEGGFFSLGKFRYQAQMTPRALAFGDTKTQGFNFDLVGMKPMTEKVSVFARVGAVYEETRNRSWATGSTINVYDHDEKEDFTYKFGAGLQYDITDALALRLEAERYRIDDMGGSKDNLDMFSVGVVYHFGGEPRAATPVAASTPPAAAPAPRPAAPAPAPAAPAPTPAPAPVRVTVSADSLFTFDSAAVQPAGRAELDALATDLRGVDFDTIVVTGHTDRIGSPDYNLRLSNTRAVAVKDYLVNTADIPSAKITTRGVNGSEPVTTPDQCSAQLTRTQLIACLAPDRRVEVEVTGTRPR